MAAILIIGSGILIGYVSSKIFIRYVNDRHKEFTENLEIEMIESNNDYKFRENVKYLLENEGDNRKDYILDINQDYTISDQINNSEKVLFC